MSFGDHFQISTGLLNQALRCGFVCHPLKVPSPHPPPLLFCVYFDRVNEIIMNIKPFHKVMDSL